MIIESGRVVAVNKDSLWVETIQKSTCSTCAAEKGCGQGLLAKWAGHTSYLRVLLEGRNPNAYRVDETVSIGIPEDVVVKGSLFVYLLPLFAMVFGAWLGQSQWGSDSAALLGAIAGLVCGGGVVRWRAHQTRNNPELQPVLMTSESHSESVVKMMDESAGS